MRKELLVLATLLAVATTGATQAAIVAELNFDSNVNVTGATNTYDDSVSSAGDMNGVRSRSDVVNGFGLPFQISDGSVEPAAGNNDLNFGGDGDTADDVTGIFGQAKTDSFFGVVDADNGNNTDITGDPNFGDVNSIATWDFDISGGNGPLTISIDIGAMGDFESSDNFEFAYQIDGGAIETLFTMTANEAITQDYQFDLDQGDTDTADGETRTEPNPVTVDDPLVLNGSGFTDVLLGKADRDTGELANFGDIPLSGTGNTLTLYLASTQNGSEAFAFDNVLIEDSGTVIPTPAAVVALPALLGAVALRRRRRA